MDFFCIILLILFFFFIAMIHRLQEDVQDYATQENQKPVQRIQKMLENDVKIVVDEIIKKDPISSTVKQLDTLLKRFFFFFIFFEKNYFSFYKNFHIYIYINILKYLSIYLININIYLYIYLFKYLYIYIYINTLFQLENSTSDSKRKWSNKTPKFSQIFIQIFELCTNASPKK